MADIIIVPVSGGKDSQVVLSLALSAGHKPVCVHQNTGYDHPATYQQLLDMEQFYGVKIEHTHDKYGGMFGFLEHAKYFPNSSARGCTQRLKQEPFANWLIAKGYTAENCEIWFGMRADESANRADKYGNAQYLGPDPYFDDLFCMAAKKAFVSTEQIMDTAGMLLDAPIQSMLLNRTMVAGVVETPNGAHFTTCTPTYERDEKFQKAYATAAKTPEDWAAFQARFLSGSETDYQDAVQAFAQEAN